MERNVILPPKGLITLDQVQAIQAATGPRRLGPAPIDWKRLKRVRIGTNNSVAYGPTSVSSTETRGLCGPVDLVVSCPALPPPHLDRDEAETTAAGVAEGLRRAPIIVTDEAPWNEPGFRGQMFPQTARVVLSTFGASNTRTVQLQRAMAGYIGTTNAVIATAVPVAGTPVAVISFQVTDTYKGCEVVVECQDHQILYLSRWTVTKNGRNEVNPFFLYGGRARCNIQAKRGDTIALNIIAATGDSFAVPCEVTVNGWTYPTINQTDGTYNRVLRSSPNWQRREGM